MSQKCITYFGMTASIPGEHGKLVQDDNGTWVDKSTGKRYREEEIGGSGAAAFNVVSVGHVGGGAGRRHAAARPLPGCGSRRRHWLACARDK